jgi:hypothetical protein
MLALDQWHGRGLVGTIASKLSSRPTAPHPSDDSGTGVPDRGLQRGDLLGLVTAYLWDVQVRPSRGSEARRYGPSTSVSRPDLRLG